MCSVWAPACEDSTPGGHAGVGVVGLHDAPSALPACATPASSQFCRLGQPTIEGSKEKRSVTRSILHKCVREMEARCVMRGVRVGEASHPRLGTLLRRLRTFRHGALTPMDAGNRTDVDSEALLDELARDLLPHGGSASPQPTALAASGELQEARRRLGPASAPRTRCLNFVGTDSHRWASHKWVVMLATGDVWC